MRTQLNIIVEGKNDRIYIEAGFLMEYDHTYLKIILGWVRASVSYDSRRMTNNFEKAGSQPQGDGAQEARGLGKFKTELIYTIGSNDFYEQNFQK